MEKSQILNSVIFLFTVELQEYHFSGGMDKYEVWTVGTHIQAPKPVVEPTYYRYRDILVSTVPPGEPPSNLATDQSIETREVRFTLFLSQSQVVSQLLAT